MLSEFTFTHSFVNSDHFPKEMDNHITIAIKDSALINAKISSCCGYYSYGNPFGCCSNQGNCVWWVYYKYGGVPFRGDAGTWYGQVPDYPIWQRGSQPCLYNDNIAWWPTYDYPPYGHVAFLHYYSGGSTISISEMLYCTSCGRSRSISYTNPDGYMWRLNTKE
jgi:hypothetical protein